jgi:outer membrane protein assembly factor BamB
MIRRILLLALALVATACNWPMSNFGPERNGFNPFATNISGSNVGSLQQEWTASNVGGNVIVANGTLYVGSFNSPFTLQAFSAAGIGCSGTPKVCTPLWTGETLGAVNDQVFGNDLVYAVTGADWLYVFDAKGQQGCAGTPVKCESVWRAAGIVGEPVVVGKFLYASGNDGRLRVYDALGNQNCSGTPKVCTPLWTAADGGRISVANNLVYAAKIGDRVEEIRAFDAAGQEGCSGSPKTCAPLWTATAPLNSGLRGDVAAPMIAGGFLYAGWSFGDESFTDGQTYVFDATGSNGCSGTPKTCTPLWDIPTDGVTSPPALAYNTLYVIDNFIDTEAGVSRNTLRAFDASECTSNPAGCEPLFTAPGVVGTPAVANGLVYAGLAGGRLAAFDAAGVTGCSGSPKVCTPVWTSDLSFSIREPVIASGRVYVLDVAVRAFALP